MINATRVAGVDVTAAVTIAHSRQGLGKPISRTPAAAALATSSQRPAQGAKIAGHHSCSSCPFPAVVSIPLLLLKKHHLSPFAIQLYKYHIIIISPRFLNIFIYIHFPQYSKMSGVVNVKRRTWDKDEYSKQALERQDKQHLPKSAIPLPEDVDVVETTFGKFKRADIGAAGPSGTDRAYLDVSAARAHLDIDSRIGKVQKVEGGARKAGYECTLCDLVFHDSDALLDHLNSRLHQGKLGFSMKIEQSSVSQVKSRLSQHLEKAMATAGTSRSLAEDSLETRLEQAEEEAQARKQAKKDAKKKKAQPVGRQDEEQALDGDVAQLLGFGSFGAGKTT